MKISPVWGVEEFGSVGGVTHAPMQKAGKVTNSDGGGRVRMRG